MESSSFSLCPVSSSRTRVGSMLMAATTTEIPTSTISIRKRWRPLSPQQNHLRSFRRSPRMLGKSESTNISARPTKTSALYRATRSSMKEMFPSRSRKPSGIGTGTNALSAAAPINSSRSQKGADERRQQLDRQSGDSV